MKTKKAFALMIVAVLAFSFLISCESKENVVKEIPAGFLKLSAAGDNLDNGGMHYTIGESQITFLDADEISIYQTKLNNSDFIVQFENSYYINKETFSKLVDKANYVAAQHNKIYSKKETIFLPGFNSTQYKVMLYSVYSDKSIDNKIKSVLVFADSFEGGVVKSIDDSIINRIFYYIETDKGNIISDFTVENGNVQVEMPTNEEISYVVVKSPDYPQCIRKIKNIYTPSNEVQTKPEGFIKLKDALEELDNGLEVVFWETQVSFVVDGLNCIYQTNADDSSLLIICENETYINEKKFLEIVALADAAIGRK